MSVSKSITDNKGIVDNVPPVDNNVSDPESTFLREPDIDFLRLKTFPILPEELLLLSSCIVKHSHRTLE